MKTKTTSIILSTLLAAAALPAHAAVTTYTDRAAFITAAGTVTTETFNAATSEDSFQSVAAVFGPLSVVGYGPLQFDRNAVDIPPFFVDAFNIDGTTNLNAVTFTDTGLVFTFATPITAWGADFAAFQDDILRSQIVVAGATLTPPIQSGNVISFFGFVSSTAFTTVTFIGNDDSDGFSIDNVSYAGAVPEPASWAMLVAGFALVGASLRRRASATA